MTTARDALLQSIERLEQALAQEPSTGERAWAATVDQALAEAEQALRQENADAHSPRGGPFKAVDMTRPALVRQVAKLRRQLTADVSEAAELRSEVQGAAHGATLDIGALRQHLHNFVSDLRRLKEGEIDVVQESVTTDLGAGD
jgi:hypothetical protein